MTSLQFEPVWRQKASLSGVSSQADLFYRCAEEMSTQPRRCVAVVNDIKGYGEDAFKKFKLTVARHNPPVCTADQAEPDRYVLSRTDFAAALNNVEVDIFLFLVIFKNSNGFPSGSICKDKPALSGYFKELDIL